MAPIKFEEDMRDKLEKRTIQPSAKSWDTLSNRLDREEKKNTRKSFWWLGIAASIVGVLLVTNFLLNTKTPNNENTIVVEDNTKKESLKIEKTKAIIEINKQEVIVETEVKTLKKPITKAKITVDKKTDYYVSNTSENNKTQNKISKKDIKKAIVLEKSEIPIETSVANIENVTAKNNSITDQELNALLSKAKEAIAMQKSNTPNVPIDYNGLLMDVEDDLNQSFRDKMFKVVKKGYETVVESVAERNE